MSQPSTSSSKRSSFARCFGCFGSGLQTQEDASETPAGTCSIFLSFISGASCSRGGLDSSTAIRKVRGHARGADVVDVAAAHYMDLFTANGNKAEESPGDVAVSAYDSDLRRTQDSIVRTTSDYQASKQSFNVTATTSGPQPQLGSPTHPATRQSSSRRTSQRALDSFLCPHAEHGDADAGPTSSPIAPCNASTSTLHRPSTESPSGPNARTPPHPGLQAFLSRGQGSASGSASSLGPTPSQTRISHPTRSRSDRYCVSSSHVPPHGSGSVSGSIGSGPAHGSPGPAIAESSNSTASLPRARTLRHPHLGHGRVASSVSLSDLRHMARANGGSCTSLCATPGTGPTTAPVVPPSAASGSLAAMAARGHRSRLSTELSLGAAAGPGATQSSGRWCSGPVPHVDMSAASKASVGASSPAGAAAVQGAYRSPIVFERHDVRVTGLPPSCLTAGKAPRALGTGGSPMPGAQYSLEASSGRMQDGDVPAVDVSRHGPGGPPVQGPSSAPLRLPHSASPAGGRTLSPYFRQPPYPAPPHGTVPDPQLVTAANSNEVNSQAQVGESASCGLDQSRFSSSTRLTYANPPLVFQRPSVSIGYLDASDPAHSSYPAIETDQPQPSRTATERPLGPTVGGSRYGSSSALPVGRYAVDSGASAVSDALSRLHEACLVAVQECPEQRYQRRNSRLPTDKSSAQLMRMYTYGSAGGLGPSWFDSDRPSDGHRTPAIGPLHVLPSSIQVATPSTGRGGRAPSAPTLSAAAPSSSGLEEGQSASDLSPFTCSWHPDGDASRPGTAAEAEAALAEAGSEAAALMTPSRQGELEALPGALPAVPTVTSSSLTSSAVLPLPLSMLTMAHTVSGGDGAAPDAGALPDATTDVVALDKLRGTSGAIPPPEVLDGSVTLSAKLSAADCGMHSGRLAGTGAVSELPSAAGQGPGSGLTLRVGRWQEQRHVGEAGESGRTGEGSEDDLHAQRLMAALLDDFVPIEHHVAHHSDDDDDGYVEFRYDGFALGGEARAGSFVGAKRPSPRASPRGYA